MYFYFLIGPQSIFNTLLKCRPYPRKGVLRAGETELLKSLSYDTDTQETFLNSVHFV